jgi:hypothetical protein
LETRSLSGTKQTVVIKVRKYNRINGAIKIRFVKENIRKQKSTLRNITLKAALSMVPILNKRYRNTSITKTLQGILHSLVPEHVAIME